METSGFFNAMENADGSYDRTYIAEQFAKFFSMFIGNGVFASPQNQLKVVAKENLTVTIKKGFAFIDGYWYYNDSDLDVDITPNATANKRVDGIFVTLDKTERTITHTYEVGRTNRIVNGSVSELKIAEVTVEVGVAVLSDSKIKDTRADNNVCGFVTGIIDVIETDDLFLQFETQFTEWFNNLDNEGKNILNDFINESNALLESFTNDKDEALNNFSVEINEWFESIKGKMSEDDIAVSLQLQVDDLRTDTDENTLKIGNLTKQVDLFDIIMSTDYTLLNSKKGGYRLNDLVGNTEQKIMSGKNLFNINGDVNTRGNDGAVGTYITVSNGVLTANTTTSSHSYGQVISGLMGKTVTFSAKIVAVGGTSAQIGIYENGSIVVHKASSTVGGTLTITHTFTSDNGCFAFTGTSGTGAQFTDIQVEIGEIATPFEEFCGGTSSPNPSFPQAIENTFDCVEMEQGDILSSTGELEQSNQYIRSKQYVPCKSGDVVNVGVKDKHNIYLYYYNESGYVSYELKQNVTNATYTIPNNVTKFKLAFRNMNLETTTPQTVGKISITVNGKYVGQIVEHGKNLLNVIDDTVDGFKITTTKNGYLVNGTSISTNGVVLLNKVLKAGTYVINGMPNGSNSTYQLYITINGSNFGYVTSHTSRKITLTQDSVVKVVLYLYKTLTNVLLPYQLEYGDTLTEYQMPIKEKVTTFFLNEPLRDTDRLVRKDGVIYEEHNVGEYIFTGEENISKTTSTGIYMQFNIMARGETLFCTHGFTFKKTDKLYLSNVMNFLGSLTAEELKAWLTEQYNNGTPVKMVYPLETPTLTPLDTESQLALNSLETFDTITYLEVDSKVKPNGIRGEYGTSQVGALALENANIRDLEAILEKERNVVRRLSGINLSSINGYIKAYCVDCTDIPVFDEGTNEGFYEQWQNDYGINMERYTVLNESGYGVGIYTRVNNVSWQKVSGNPADEIAWSEVVVSGSPTIVRIELPSGFTLDNCIIIASYFKKDNVELYNQIEGTKSDGSIQRDSLWYQKNIDANQYALWLSSFGVNITYNGTLRVYFQRIM